MSDSIQFKQVLDASASFISTIDTSGKILFINTSFAKILCGKSPESLVGKVAASTTDSTDLSGFFSDLTSKNDISAYPMSIVLPVNRKSEKSMWIKFNISKINTPSSIFISGNDITEEILAKREAEQKTLERSSFLVRMGHELRTPLNTVLGYVKLLQGLDNLSPVAQEYISTILTNEQNLLHLMNDVLELSKYESGQTEMTLSEVNLKKIFDDVDEKFKTQFESKYLTLSIEYKTPIPAAILTDAEKVMQVISSLVGNALKFTRKGGVSINVACGKLVTIEVSDTGIGIDPADFSRVFDLYSHADNSKEHMTGSGIGLAVGRISARMLGGDLVLVRSDPGMGSLFKLTFEANTVEPLLKNFIPVIDYSSITGISRPCKVLLVDDVDINLAMLEIFLAPAGFDVSIALDGNEAVDKFKSFKPDIVFMDLIMPGKDGFEATREIKALNPNIPVIALTASIAENIREQAMASGVNDFMTKPFVPERFFEIIAGHTGITYILST